MRQLVPTDPFSVANGRRQGEESYVGRGVELRYQRLADILWMLLT